MRYLVLCLIIATLTALSYAGDSAPEGSPGSSNTPSDTAVTAQPYSRRKVIFDAVSQKMVDILPKSVTDAFEGVSESFFASLFRGTARFEACRVFLVHRLIQHVTEISKNPFFENKTSLLILLLLKDLVTSCTPEAASEWMNTKYFNKRIEEYAKNANKVMFISLKGATDKMVQIIKIVGEIFIDMFKKYILREKDKFDQTALDNAVKTIAEGLKGNFESFEKFACEMSSVYKKSWEEAKAKTEKDMPKSPSIVRRFFSNVKYYLTGRKRKED